MKYSKLGLAPEITKSVFPIIKNLYDLSNEIKLKSRNSHKVRHAIETAFLVVTIIWSSIPRSCKECNSGNKGKN